MERIEFCPTCSCSVVANADRRCPTCATLVLDSLPATQPHALPRASCPASEQLCAFYNYELNDELSSRIEAHLDTCIDCATKLEAISAQQSDSTILGHDTLASAAQFVPPSSSGHDVAQHAWPLGDVIQDRYEVLQVFARGGFGAVYQAYDRQLERQVAVKAPLHRPQNIRSFLDEARKLARLDHRHVLRVYDAGQTETGQVYFVTQWIDGTTLAERMRKAHVSRDEAVDIVAKVADALVYLHANQIYHRDVKPANIVLDANGEPILIDFGLAVTEGTLATAPAAGTPLYVSPEQARGEIGRGASDVFSLGIVLFELLTRQRPFSNINLIRNPAIAAPRARELGSSISVELDQICAKALHKDPQARFATALDFRRALRRVQRGSRWKRQKKMLACITVATALVVLAAVGTTRVRHHRAERLVKQLLTSDAARIGPTLDQLDRSGDLARARLMEAWGRAKLPEARWRLAVALLGPQATTDVLDSVLQSARNRTRKELVLARQRLRVASLPGSVPLRAFLLHRPDASHWDLLDSTADPSVRYDLATWLGRLSTEPGWLAEQILSAEHEPGVHVSLIFAVGEFQLQEFQEPSRSRIVARLNTWLGAAESAELHAAARWLLRKWDLQLLNDWLQTPSRPANDQRRWYVNGQQHTMIRFPRTSFAMGTPSHQAPSTPSETLHNRSIDYHFSMASTEVTVFQFNRFLKSISTRTTMPNSELVPAANVSWYEAAHYCNWLSEQEGLPRHQWCYVPNKKGQYRSGMKIAADVDERHGYRLPTEPEWEFACRAGSAAGWPCGNTELVDQFAWIKSNSGGFIQDVGTKKPNALGLFDMIGNVLEWCHHRHIVYQSADGQISRAFQQTAGVSVSNAAGVMMQRGGHARAPIDLARSAIRYSDPPGVRNPYLGFRVAKTESVASYPDE